MKHAAELVSAIKNIVAINDAVFPGIVQSVDKVKNTCEVLYNDMELGGVRLQAIIKADTKGFKIYPAQNSAVLVARLGNKGEFFITMYSVIESVVVEIEDSKIEINADGFLFQKEEETLKKILDDLLDGIGNIVVPTNSGPSGNPLNKATFTAIKNRVNNLLK